MAYIQKSSGVFAARMITAKSIPRGRKKMIDESRALSTTSPGGVRK